MECQQLSEVHVTCIEQRHVRLDPFPRADFPRAWNVEELERDKLSTQMVLMYKTTTLGHMLWRYEIFSFNERGQAQFKTICGSIRVKILFEIGHKSNNSNYIC